MSTTIWGNVFYDVDEREFFLSSTKTKRNYPLIEEPIIGVENDLVHECAILLNLLANILEKGGLYTFTNLDKFELF